MSVDSSDDFHALAAFCEAHAVAPPPRGGNRRLNKTLALVLGSLVSQGIGEVDEHRSPPLAFVPLLEPPMARFPVGIALRHQVPVCSGRIQGTASKTARAGTGWRPGRRSGRRSSRKELSNPRSLVVAQS